MTTNAWATKTQDSTLVTADAHREPWTRDELDFVIEFTDTDTDADLAVALGRSLYAIWTIQHRIRTEGVAGVIERLEREASRPLRVCPTHFVTLPATGVCDDCD